MPKSSILVLSAHRTFTQAFSQSFSHCLLENLKWSCTCAFLSGHCRMSVYYGAVCDCVPRCLQIIKKLLLCSFGLILHLSQDRPHPIRHNLAWCCKSRTTDDHFMFLPFLNNCSSSCHLLTKRLANGLVAHTSSVQV